MAAATAAATKPKTGTPRPASTKALKTGSILTMEQARALGIGGRTGNPTYGPEWEKAAEVLPKLTRENAVYIIGWDAETAETTFESFHAFFQSRVAELKRATAVNGVTRLYSVNVVPDSDAIAIVYRGEGPLPAPRTRKPKGE